MDDGQGYARFIERYKVLIAALIIGLPLTLWCYALPLMTQYHSNKLDSVLTERYHTELKAYGVHHIYAKGVLASKHNREVAILSLKDDYDINARHRGGFDCFEGVLIQGGELDNHYCSLESYRVVIAVSNNGIEAHLRSHFGPIPDKFMSPAQGDWIRQQTLIRTIEYSLSKLDRQRELLVKADGYQQLVIQEDKK